MIINDDKEYNPMLSRGRYNSFERKKMEYFFPNNQALNRTIDYGEKDLFKPRIIKNKKMYDSNNNNGIYLMNYNDNFNKKKLNNSMDGYTTYNLDNINNMDYYNRDNVPRIVRNRKNVHKYINKGTNLRGQRKSNNMQGNYDDINAYNIKRNNSIDRNNYGYNNRRNNSIDRNNYIYNTKRSNSTDRNSYIYNENKNDYNINYNNYNNRNGNNNKYYNNYDNIKNNEENDNLRSTRHSSFDNKSRASDYFTYLICKSCFDRKMLEDENEKNGNNFPIDQKEYLNDKFINENPFYFIDKINDDEKKRINDKIESNSYKQRLALDNYKKEIDDPKNNTKEKLQLLNEYSLNPLTIEAGKDPRYLKQKKNYDKKERIIHQNPDIYKGLEPRKAYNDYYNKCIYQIPKIEESYYINPVYKQNYIKALKKQIEDKKNKEYEDRKKQRDAEALANKKFNEYKRMANLNDLAAHNNGIQKMKNDNRELDDFKNYKNNVLRAREKRLGNELSQMKNQIDQDMILRSQNERNENVGNYKNWLDDVERKMKQKKDNKDEERRRWNNYIERYKYRCNHDCVYANCDMCNRPYEKNKLRRFPPPNSVMVEYNLNKLH